MHELFDSTSLRPDHDQLRRRLADDGYLFLRGLLRAADVRAALDAVRAELSVGGWIDGNGSAGSPSRSINVRAALADPSLRAALASRGLNRLAFLSPLRDLVRLLLGPGAFCYPVKVLRVDYPEGHSRPTKGRYVHYDYATSGVQDMLTTWLPLMNITAQLGGMAVLPGSHLGPPSRPWLLQADEPGWATTDYRPGDVLLFHCLTAQAALPNHADSLRISADFGWQAADQPAPAELVLGPAPAPGRGRRARQGELFSQVLGREPWWEPVPDGLQLLPRHQLVSVPPAPSRLIAVHPGWQRWRTPPSPAQ